MKSDLQSPGGFLRSSGAEGQDCVYKDTRRLLVLLPVTITLAFEGVVQQQWDLAPGVVPTVPVIVVVVSLPAGFTEEKAIKMTECVSWTLGCTLLMFCVVK